jgi:hypothetical protein
MADVVRSAARKHMQVVHNERLQVAPETAADGTEARLERLRAVYATLDEKCRKVLDRFYHGREDLATIATAMGRGRREHPHHQIPLHDEAARASPHHRRRREQHAMKAGALGRKRFEDIEDYVLGAHGGAAEAGL